ncbi:MAG: hypothetical protein LT102_04350 [Burkholderiaceae bacterium]|nr:hypothetical protein [Burkholderiaceae bacterium]
MKMTRVFDSLLGVAFVAIALYLLLRPHPSSLAGSLAAALVLGVLGVDALVSALRSRRSLLSRIGPLP